MHVFPQRHVGLLVVGIKVAETLGALPRLAACHLLVHVEDMDGFFQWCAAEDGATGRGGGYEVEG